MSKPPTGQEIWDVANGAPPDDPPVLFSVPIIENPSDVKDLALGLLTAAAEGKISTKQVSELTPTLRLLLDITKEKPADTPPVARAKPPPLLRATTVEYFGPSVPGMPAPLPVEFLPDSEGES